MAPDPFKYFRIEGAQLLDELGAGTLALEKGAAPEIVAKLLRLAHTLKGAARVVRQVEIADLAHRVEDTLAPLRESGAASRAQIDGLLADLDTAKKLLGRLGAPVDSAPVAPATPQPEEPRRLRADLHDMDALLDGITEVGAHLSTLRQSLGELDRARHSSELLEARVARLKGAAAEAGKARSLAVEVRDRVASTTRALSEGLEQIDRELYQVRDSAQRLRLLPVGLVFGSLERTVRDLAISVGRKVTFSAKGGELRLDADLLSAIEAALVQVVRNAVAHGIEPEAERIAAGKPREGRVVLEVHRVGQRVAFVCRDDGRGIDLEAVRRVAKEKNKLPADSGPEALMQVLLKGGISTAVKVSADSGRGVGLDVLRETALRLGGEAKLRSTTKVGTTAELIVPTTLSALDALVVVADRTTAAIPRDGVRRALRISSAELSRTADGEALLVDGSLLPFLPLARILDPSIGDLGRRAWSAVIVEVDGVAAVLGVDRLVGIESVAVRPLPPLTPATTGIGGATLDADGNPRLVLDVRGVVEVIHHLAAAPVAGPAAQIPIMVIDDSLTTRMLEQSILESAGYQVETATSAEEGLEKAMRRRYALFLVDVEMPGIDGFTFIERIRAMPQLADIPAILVTSRSDVEDRRRGEAVGAQAYIVKSEFDQNELLARIRKLVE